MMWHDVATCIVCTCSKDSHTIKTSLFFVWCKQPVNHCRKERKFKYYVMKLLRLSFVLRLLLKVVCFVFQGGHTQRDC